MRGLESDSRMTPAVFARIAGGFYLLVIVTSSLAMYLRKTMTVPHDAAMSANNILAHESLYRLGLACDIVSSACYVVVTGLFYYLFKPVSKRMSLIAAMFSVVAIAVGTVGGLFNAAALSIVRGAAELASFSSQQTSELALLSTKLGSMTVNIGIVLFGCYCVSIGWLIVKSRFIPAIFGVGLILAGLGWLTFIYQPMASALLPFNLACGGIGETALTLWLLARGVNTDRWNEQARLVNIA